MRTARSRLAEPIAWAVVLAVASLTLVLVKFDSQDPDSSSYALISARLASLPVRVWIAPEWWGLGGREGLFREHPVGAFILPALLGKLGVPPVQAAYVVGAALSIAVLLLVRRVAAMIVTIRLTEPRTRHSSKDVERGKSGSMFKPRGRRISRR